MDKNVVHIYNRILVIKRNEVESVVVRWMNLEPSVHSEDRKHKYHINTYMESRKVVLINLLAEKEQRTHM